jgi:hypothetical protein
LIEAEGPRNLQELHRVTEAEDLGDVTLQNVMVGVSEDVERLEQLQNRPSQLLVDRGERFKKAGGKRQLRYCEKVLKHTFVVLRHAFVGKHLVLASF